MPPLPDWTTAIPIITLVGIGILLVNGIRYAIRHGPK